MRKSTGRLAFPKPDLQRKGGRKVGHLRWGLLFCSDLWWLAGWRTRNNNNNKQKRWTSVTGIQLSANVNQSRMDCSQARSFRCVILSILHPSAHWSDSGSTKTERKKKQNARDETVLFLHPLTPSTHTCSWIRTVVCFRHHLAWCCFSCGAFDYLESSSRDQSRSLKWGCLE